MTKDSYQAHDHDIDHETEERDDAIIGVDNTFGHVTGSFHDDDGDGVEELRASWTPVNAIAEPAR